MDENNRNKKKPPKYVVVYNQILKMIQDGVYCEGGKLPTEPELARNLDVSRVTLRQALRILVEDGIIENRHGVGNFVRASRNDTFQGLEKISNPIYKCCNEEIASVEIKHGMITSPEYRNYFLHILKKEMPAVLVADRSYFDQSGEILSFCESIVNIEIFSKVSVDVNKKEELLELLERQIYTIAHRVKLEIKCLLEKDWARNDQISWDTSLIFVIFESLYDSSGQVMVSNKFYLPGEKMDLVVNLYN